MNEHNQKALDFCHTHPNLFLQQHCKNCKRGMCHTCIHNNRDYCTECLSDFKRLGSSHEDKKQILTALILAISTSFLVSISLFYSNYTIQNSPITESVLITFFATLSIVSCYYLFQESDIFSSINKIPFIGFKLSMLLLIFLIISGLPILYLFYKSVLLIRTYYFKQL